MDPCTKKRIPHQNLSKEAKLDLVLYLINAGRVGLLKEENSFDLLLGAVRQTSPSISI